MCYSCILLGMLVNHGRAPDDPFDVSTLRVYDFRLERGATQMVDAGAQAFLAAPLRALAARGERLIPVAVQGDGNCQAHAVSRCLVGAEIFYHALRTSLAHELETHEAFYREALGEFFDADMFAAEVRDAAPTLDADRGGRWMSTLHVFALSNVLRRPIVVLADEGNQEHCGGLFVPARHSPEDCRAELGRVPTPLCIGWSSAQLQHFIALVPERLDVMAVATELAQQNPAFWAGVADLADERVLRALVELQTNTTETRALCRDTLLKLLRNVARHPTEDKFRRVRLTNRGIQTRVLSIRGGRGLLESVGFAREGTGDSLVLPASVDPARGLFAAVLRTLEAMPMDAESSAILRGLAFSAEPGVGDEGVLRRVWYVENLAGGEGADLWGFARQYCSGSAWSFGGGDCPDAFWAETHAQLKRRFEAVTAGRFGGYTDALRRDMQVRCPVCRALTPVADPRRELFSCASCANVLTLVRRTLYQELAEIVAGALAAADPWECAVCTYQNEVGGGQCAMCGSVPGPVADVSGDVDGPPEPDEDVVRQLFGDTPMLQRTVSLVETADGPRAYAVLASGAGAAADDSDLPPPPDAPVVHRQASAPVTSAERARYDAVIHADGSLNLDHLRALFAGPAA